MKFFYNGQLLRTSKTKEYTHAVVREKENGTYVLWGCASSYDGASRALTQAVKVNATYRIVPLVRK